jgi:hypothetical protein
LGSKKKGGGGGGSNKKGPPEQKKLKASSSGKKKKKASAAVAEEEEKSLQHQEWVKFQQHIHVEGFDTGQTLKERSTKKVRGGKARYRAVLDEVAEAAAERHRLTDAGGGEFPPERYSDEETERLLAQAYAALPERGGKRGTRNLKRQGRRWRLVREIRAKYKYHLAEYQTRKMENRSRKVREVKEILAEAPEIRDRDRQYQAEVFRRWAQIMTTDQGDEVEQGEGRLIEEEK